MSNGLLRSLVGALASTASSKCLAITSTPFNVGGLALFIALYFVGLVVLFCRAPHSKERALAFAIYLLTPVVFFFVVESVTSRRNSEVLRQEKEGEAMNAQAFSYYCRDRKRTLAPVTILAENQLTNDSALYVRLHENFTGNKPRFNAGMISHSLQADADRCAQTGLHAIEGLYAVIHAEHRGLAQEVRKFSACEKSQGEVISSSYSLYELAIGEISQTDRTPWGDSWMSRSSARIWDRKTGQTLSEDTLYFLRHESGVGKCPQAADQLAELIYGTFLYSSQ